MSNNKPTEWTFPERCEAVRFRQTLPHDEKYVIVFLPEGGCKLIKDAPPPPVRKVKEKK